MAVLRRLVLGGLLAGALVACGSGAPPEGSNGTGQGLAEPTAIPQSEPVALRIPSIGVNTEQKWMPLGKQGSKQGTRTVPVETVAGKKMTGAIESPPVSKPKQLGWYCPTGLAAECGWPTPGNVLDQRAAVIAGHVNGGGQAGVFARLHEVKKGDTVEVTRVDGYVATFTVTKTEQILKTDVTVDQIYGQIAKGAPKLVLLTCGGVADRANHRYLHQIVVTAELTSFKPKAV